MEGWNWETILLDGHYSDTQRRRRPSGARGQANAGGARGLEYSLGIRGEDKTKHSKNTIMTLLCDM